MAEDTYGGMFLNFILSHLLKKVVVPSDYHNQVIAVKEMQQDDVTGLVDSLTDLYVKSASVEFSIESENEEFTKKLNKWLKNMNAPFKGEIPRGVAELAKEYYRERWKYSSFPVLKITGWEKIDGILLPMKMFFVDGGSIYAKKKDEKSKTQKLLNYDYFLGREMKEELESGVIITKPYNRVYEKYPTPFLIKRGVYHNWKLIQAIKNKESEILEQIIPYLMLVKKGSDALATTGIKTYSDAELTEVKNRIQEIADEIKNTETANSSADTKVKSPIRVTQYDEEINHLMPDLSTMFKREIFEVAEKNILSGLGFLDVVEAVSTSRRESIMNPKGFIEEARDGVEGFKLILDELLYRIIEKNKEAHPKYASSNPYIVSAPVNAFMTADDREKLRQLYDRGTISKKTITEATGEIDFNTEVIRRKKETKEGVDAEMYPPIIQNTEEKGQDFPSKTPEEETQDEVPDDKKGIEKKNFNASSLEGAPYKTVSDLPSAVKNSMDIELQRTYMRVFNNAFSLYDNETRAFRVAWSVIRQIARKGKDGKWHRKRQRENGKLVKVKLTKAMIEKALDKEEKDAVEEAMQIKAVELEAKKEKLLDKLLNPKKE